MSDEFGGTGGYVVWPQFDQWEHMLLEWDPESMSHAKFEYQIDEHGELGWKLVSVVQRKGRFLAFLRRKRHAANAFEGYIE